MVSKTTPSFLWPFTQSYLSNERLRHVQQERLNSCGRLIIVSLHLEFVNPAIILGLYILKFSRSYHEL